MTNKFIELTQIVLDASETVTWVRADDIRQVHTSKIRIVATNNPHGAHKDVPVTFVTLVAGYIVVKETPDVVLSKIAACG